MYIQIIEAHTSAFVAEPLRGLVMIYVKWSMGFNPVGDKDWIDVLFKDGTEILNFPANGLNWQNDDILAYRRKSY